MITRDQLKAACAAALPYYDAIVTACQRCDITAPRRQAAFLAQCAHESSGFKRFVENLNYSAAGLAATWPSRFYVPGPGIAANGKRNAAEYARQPKKIAEAVYGGRMGNGQEGAGDGAKYIGRGPLQTTGHDNYRAVSIALYGDDRLLRQPELLEQPGPGFLAAAWHWADMGLNALADAGDHRAITLRINGGLTGFDDGDRSDLDTRMDWVVRFNKALGIVPAVAA